MKNLRDSLPSWIDSDRAAAVGSLKVCCHHNFERMTLRHTRLCRGCEHPHKTSSITQEIYCDEIEMLTTRIDGSREET